MTITSSSPSSVACGITLSAKGPRSVVTVEEAQRVRSQWLALLNDTDNDENKDDDKIATVGTTVDLSCRAWPLACLKVLQDVFEKEQVQQHVQVLKLDDIIASLDTEAGLESLAFFASLFSTSQSLTTLILSDNAIGTRGVQVLRPLLSKNNPPLTSLDFNNCGMSAQVALALKEILLPHSFDLKALALSRNQMGSDGAEHISELVASCSTLERLEYAGSRPLAVGTWHLCRGLAQSCSSSATNSTLKVLDLDDCVLGDGSNTEANAVYPLCEVLTACAPSLQKLVLKDGGLECDGLALVLEALQLLSSSSDPDTTDNIDTPCGELVYLDLGALGFGEKGATLLAQALLNNRDNNKLKKLTHLLLETNEMGDEGLQLLVDALSLKDDATTSSCLPALRVLNLNDNDITPVGLRILVDNPIPSLETLHLKDNPDLEEEDDDDEDDDDDYDVEELTQQLKGMYKKVVLLEEDEEEHDEDNEEEDDSNGDIDALAGELAGAHISSS